MGAVGADFRATCCVPGYPNQLETFKIQEKGEGIKKTAVSGDRKNIIKTFHFLHTQNSLLPIDTINQSYFYLVY